MEQKKNRHIFVRDLEEKKNQQLLASSLDVTKKSQNKFSVVSTTIHGECFLSDQWHTYDYKCVD